MRPTRPAAARHPSAIHPQPPFPPLAPRRSRCTAGHRAPGTGHRAPGTDGSGRWVDRRQQANSLQSINLLVFAGKAGGTVRRPWLRRRARRPRRSSGRTEQDPRPAHACDPERDVAWVCGRTTELTASRVRGWVARRYPSPLPGRSTAVHRAAQPPVGRVSSRPPSSKRTAADRLNKGSRPRPNPSRGTRMSIQDPPHSLHVPRHARLRHGHTRATSRPTTGPVPSRS